jgi:hypothetical protein
MSRLGARAAATAALTLLATAGAAQAGPPGTWTQVTGVGGQADLNILEVGLARTADGRLHVSWTRDAGGNAGSVLHSSVAANAGSVSGPDTIHTYPGGANEHSVILAVPGGLRAFFAGLEAGSVLDRAMVTSTSGDGVSWTPPVPASQAGSGASPVYVASGIGAAMGLDGTFYSVWGDSSPSGGGFHVGLDPSVPDQGLPGGLAIDPNVGVDSATGQVVLAWNLLDEGGLAAMSISPAGARVTLPGSGAEQLQHRVGITGRLGAPGIFVAYTQGTNQFLGKPAVWRFDTGKPTRLSNVQGARDVSIAAAPNGRLWVFWHRAETVFAVRSNPTATRWGRTVAVKPPRGTDTISNLAGEGSRGPLDVLALADTSTSGFANWHQRILPGLSLTAVVGKNGKVTFRATDAGDPVKGAKVTVKGGPSAKTKANGRVTFTLGKGRHRAKGTKGGYSPASAQARVR